MKEFVRFFWERDKRAAQMDAANKERNLPTPYLNQAQEWIDAYKGTLSNSKKSQFDKEWQKLDKELEEYRNSSPKQQSHLNPMGI